MVYLLGSLCIFFYIRLLNINEKKTINGLILLLTPYINELRKSCIDCKLYSGYITVAEIAHLLVLNKQNKFSTAVDTNVYSRYQQFRLFDCVKRDQTTLVKLAADSSFA